MDDRTKRRLRACEALIARGATEGERSAARAARGRILETLGLAADTAFQPAEPVRRGHKPSASAAGFDDDLRAWAKAAAARQQARREARARAEAAMAAAAKAEAERRARRAAEEAAAKARAEATMAAAAKAARRARAASNGKLAQQPQMKRLLDMVGRPSGATAEEIGAALGLKPHTVRAAISRLKGEGAAIRTIPYGRGGKAIYTTLT
jgi:membrane protein involved in colicin uptake